MADNIITDDSGNLLIVGGAGAIGTIPGDSEPEQGGETWAISASGLSNVFAIAASETGQYGVAALAEYPSNFVYYTTDRGANWNAATSLSLGDTDYVYGAAVSNNGQYMYACTTLTNLCKSENYGTTWTKIPGIYRAQGGIKCSADGQHIVISAVFGGGSHISHNYGTSFALIAGSTGIYHTRTCAMSNDGSIIYLVGDSQKVYKSSNSGVSCSVLPNSPQLNVAGRCYLATNGDGSLVVAGTDSSLFISYDGGATWTDISAGNGGFGIACSSSGNTIFRVSGSNARISHDAGATWATSVVGTTTPNECACSDDGSTMYIGDVGNGTIYRSPATI